MDKEFLDILQEAKVFPWEKSYQSYLDKIIKTACVICNETRYIEKCHIIPREYDYIIAKWDLFNENIICLCPNCHKYMDNKILTNEEYNIIKPKISNMINKFYNICSKYIQYSNSNIYGLYIFYDAMRDYKERDKLVIIKDNKDKNVISNVISNREMDNGVTINKINMKG